MGLGESMALLLNATTVAGVLGDDDDLEEDDEAVFLDVMDPNLDDPRQHVPADLQRRGGGEGGASDAEAAAARASLHAQFEAAGLLSDRLPAAAAASGVAVRPSAAAGAGLLDSGLLPQPADAPTLPQPAPAALLLLPPPALAASSSNGPQLPSNQRASMPPVSAVTTASSRRVTSAPLGSTGNAAAKLQSAIGKLLGKDVAEENPWKVRKRRGGCVWGPVGSTTRWHLSGSGRDAKRRSYASAVDTHHATRELTSPGSPFLPR
jgi:hypothetical protein